VSSANRLPCTSPKTRYRSLHLPRRRDPDSEVGTRAASSAAPQLLPRPQLRRDNLKISLIQYKHQNVSQSPAQVSKTSLPVRATLSPTGTHVRQRNTPPTTTNIRIQQRDRVGERHPVIFCDSASVVLRVRWTIPTPIFQDAPPTTNEIPRVAISVAPKRPLWTTPSTPTAANPVPTFEYSTVRRPLPAPINASANAAAFVSFSMIVGSLNRCANQRRNANPSHP